MSTKVLSSLYILSLFAFYLVSANGELRECMDDGRNDRLSCPEGRALVRLENDTKPNGCGPSMFEDATKAISGFIPDEFHAVCNLHDICYTNCGVTRKECDDIFYTNMKTVLGSMSRVNQSIYSAFPTIAYESVKSFGCSSFQDSMMKNCGCAKVKDTPSSSSNFNSNTNSASPSVSNLNTSPPSSIPVGTPPDLVGGVLSLMPNPAPQAVSHSNVDLSTVAPPDSTIVPRLPPAPTSPLTIVGSIVSVIDMLGPPKPFSYDNNGMVEMNTMSSNSHQSQPELQSQAQPQAQAHRSFHNIRQLSTLVNTPDTTEERV